ncbi:MAG: hypothetical protein IPJ65_11675 [Archangiaceae bacterium]|nr:hypothetical protein [Archangiaceae bacterium]
MKLLVFDRDESGGRELSLGLARAGRELTVVPDEGAALAAFVRGPVPLALLVARDTPDAALRLARQVRGVPHGKASLLALVAAGLTERQLNEGYEAGFDVHLQLGMSMGALSASLRGLERLASAHGAPVAAALAPVAAPAPVAAALSLSPFEQVTRATAWRTAPALFQAAAAKFLTLDVGLGASPPTPGSLATAQRIVLSSAAHELELAITLGATQKSGAGLAVHLFGPGSEGLAADVLGELSNIFMGTLKTSLSAESFAFTGGLPAAVAAEETVRPSITFKQQETFALALGDASLAVHLGLRSRANQLLAPGELREGMVVARDVLNARGLMLINKGTRLSANMIDKLRANLAPKAQLEVTAS